jgi:2-polyprenyl-3-methyl-5-hydroxy-6-metoxy-1,4-benzoquinol methylase
LVRDLRRLGRDALLYLPGLGEGRTEAEAREVLAQVIENLDEVPLVCDGDAPRRDWDFVIFDRFATPAREFNRFFGATPVIGIDEGGPERPRFDFLLDLLPSLPSRPPPNTLRPDLLCLPAKRKDAGGAAAPLKILVSFGGEDAAGLGPVTARACAVTGLAELTLVSGALNRETAGGAAFTSLPFIKNLRDRLAEYDLLITHFGVCAFEALYAGVPVLLVSPDRLHEALARAARLFSAGRGVKSAARLGRLLFSGGRLNTAFLGELTERCAEAARRYKLDGPPPETLAAYINRLEPKALPSCPLCGQQGRAAARFRDRTYRRCPRCNTLYMSRAGPPDIRYTEAYFFENYKKQYGKTYLEDFPNLTAQARRRLTVIKGLLENGPRGGLLDIGCAYGAFLSCARGEGFHDCAGIDASAGAVMYVRDKLNINAARGLFPDDGLPQTSRKFDVVTLWYVIEHFENVKTVLEKIYSLLNSGGLLAFSTPNGSGISGRLSRKRILEKSPADHWTVWDARRVKKVLRRFGFAVKKVVITGHHPERFPFCSRLTGGRGIVYRTVLALSKLLRLGDTFEVYAKKIPQRKR